MAINQESIARRPEANTQGEVLEQKKMNSAAPGSPTPGKLRIGLSLLAIISSFSFSCYRDEINHMIHLKD